MTKKNNTIVKYIFFAVSACLLLMLASRSSFLYTFNNWDDANSYFSVGKGIFNGKMPYRDIFDQKGMYLYFLYGIAYLISHTTFFGVYILEAVLGFIDICFFYKIIKLYAKDYMATALAPVTYAVIVCSRSFWWGGAAEEICMPFLVIGLYLFAAYFERDYKEKVMPFGTVFAGGILAGMIANTKFTMLGFYFAWMMMVFFAYLAHKDFAGGIKACFVFLFGMFLPFVPWILYFGVQNSLYEWYWGYVYVNVFVYPTVKEDPVSLYGRVYKLAKLLYNLMLDNKVYFALVVPGIIYTLLKKGEKILARFSIAVLFGFLFLGIFGGGRSLPYYSLPLGIFAVFGFALLGAVLDFAVKGIFEEKKNTAAAVMSIICLAASIVIVYVNSMNISFMSEDESYFMYRFRDEVLQEEDPTLLNVGCLDAGLYTLCDIVPSCRWFQTQTLNIEEDENNPYKEQERYVREGLVDFVLVRDTIPLSINDHYDLIDQADYSYSGYDFKYYLYKKVK